LPLHCPRGYIFLPPETRRTFHWCLYIAPGVTSPRPQKHGGLFLFLACTRSTTRRSLSCLYIAPGVTSSRPQKHGGLFLFLACTHSTARRSLSCLYIAPGVTSSRPQKHGGLLLASRRARALRSFNWCLRSPKNDEDFKNFN